MSVPELKPCPFCGGQPEWNKGARGDGTDWNYLACSECEAMGPYRSDADTSPFDEAHNRETDITAWNTRHDISQAQIAAAYTLAAFQADVTHPSPDGEPTLIAKSPVGDAIRALTPDTAQAALDRMIAEAVEAERESIAKEIEDWQLFTKYNRENVTMELASTIRSRGKSDD